MAKYDSNGRLLKNKGTNFFDKLSVSSASFDDNKTSWDFTSQGFSIVIESSNASDVIEYSFDGTELHGDLTPGFSGIMIWDDRRQNKIWFRRKTAGSAVIVRVEAWRNDY